MTPMSEIATCLCGTRDTGVDNDYDGWAVTCNDCGCRGPFVPTYEEAIAAWSALMRQRPVARWGAPAVVTYLYVGRAVLGYVLTGQSGESAVCGITGEHFRGYDARAWLEERVRAAGFEVREEVSDE